MKKSAKRGVVAKEIPADRHGVVGSTELLKILGISYMNLFNWCKSGKITPLPSEGRKKTFDLDQVRAQLAGTYKSEPQVHGSGGGSRAEVKTQAPEITESVPEKAGEQPAAQSISRVPPSGFRPNNEVLIAAAEKNLLKFYRRKLKKIALATVDPTDKLHLLEFYFQLEHAKIKILPNG